MKNQMCKSNDSLCICLLSVVRPGCKIAGIVSVTVEVRMMDDDDDNK
jgi:hypothetical protein